MRNYRSTLSSIIVAGLCSGGVLMAQGTQTANVTGQAVLRSGGPASGVTVRLTSPSLQGTRTTVTDAKGRFAVRLLPPGSYTITLYKEDLITLKTEATIGVGQSFEPKFVMSPVGGAVVEVVATASTIDKTDVKSATNYSLDAVDKLPNGRTLEAVALLTPGVTLGVGSRVQIRGAMTSGNLFLLDGQNIADNVYNNRGINLIDDSIEEVQVITGAASAEYGSMDGGVINAVTRSGGNEFHGQVRYEMQNNKWNAVNPPTVRGSINDATLLQKTASLSGYILKDKLWFSGSFYEHDTSVARNIAAAIPGGGNGPNGYGAAFNTLEGEIRRQIKLTYAINQNHTLVGSFSNSNTAQENRNYSAGELAALVPQTNSTQFANLSWRAIWSNSVTSELKVGRKKQTLSAGAVNASLSPVYNYDNGYFYQNGIFNSGDGGDNRDNKTVNLKVSLFWDAIGSHQTDFGGEYYKGIQRARNDQSVTGYIFGTYGMNLPNQTAYGADVWTYVSGDGSANNYTNAFFVNDRWTINPHASVMLGLRMDHFKAVNESGASTAAASGLSPRLGLKYDLNADGKYVFGASYARYNSKVLEAITNRVTKQGNATEIDHPYIGPSGPQSFAYLTNLANLSTLYNLSAISWYNDPTVNVRLSDNLKAPTVDEYQVSFMYSFNNPLGNGFVRATGVYKNWNNLIDYRAGNDGTVSAAGQDIYVKVWENSDVAKRRYRALELDGQFVRGKFSLQGNFTLSELKGNYEGEASSSPGKGEGLKNFTVQDGVKMYDSSTTAPYGYLTGHNPFSSRITASYGIPSSWGETTFGLVYRLDAGARYSITRTVPSGALNADLSSQIGSYSTQYLGERGSGGTYPSQQQYDLAITQDLPVFKVLGKSVSAFVKVRIENLFNKVQRTSFDTTYESAGALSEAWTRTENYGTSNSTAYYMEPRTIKLSAAIKF